MSTENQHKLVRTTFIWTLYILLGLFSFMLSMIGPMVPYLQDEFNMSYSFAALHQSAFALGMVVIGILGTPIIKKIGLFSSLWGGIIGMIIGLFIMIEAKNAYFTIAGIFFMSICGTILLSAIQSAFPKQNRSKIVIEANTMASAFSMSVPLFLLLGSKTSMNWRFVFPVMLVGTILCCIIGIPSSKRDLEPLEEEKKGQKHKLPAKYWQMWIVTFLGVSVEWAVSFWCMSYLLLLPGNSRTLAAFGTVVLGLSAILGRFTSSKLTEKFSARKLLFAVILITLIGFPLYFFRPNIVLTFIGLILCGLGSTNFYPLAVGVALDNADGNTVKAGSLIPAASGLAIGLAPLLLGKVADSFSLTIAMCYIPLGLVLITIILLIKVKK